MLRNVSAPAPIVVLDTVSAVPVVVAIVLTPVAAMVPPPVKAMPGRAVAELATATSDIVNVPTFDVLPRARPVVPLMGRPWTWFPFEPTFRPLPAAFVMVVLVGFQSS